MELFKQGNLGQEELTHLLLSVQKKFGQAIKATATKTYLGHPGMLAARDIFEATYNALSFCKWDDRLPTFKDLPENLFDDAILPPPILFALAFFLNSPETICLASWNFRTGNHAIDNAIVSWPGTILWGLPAKMRFFYDIKEAYAGYPTPEPLLSNTSTRAVQLLVVGKYLLEKEINKINHYS